MIFPPLIVAEVVCIIAWAVIGGQFWWWLLVGWLISAPLTLAWAMFLARRDAASPTPCKRTDEATVTVTQFNEHR